MSEHFVEVQVTRDIRVGNRYTINSSYGYAGIQDGVVVVRGICTPLEDEEVSKSADSFIEAELDVSIEDYHNGKLGHMSEYPAIVKEAKEWDSGLWVSYSYPEIPDEGIVYLPLAIFADRIVTR